MKKIIHSVIAGLLTAGMIVSVGLASASGVKPLTTGESGGEYGLSEDFPYYETVFHYYSAPAIAQETLSYINQSNPFWVSADQIGIAVAIKTASEDTKAENLIRYINSHQNKVNYVKASFSNQGEYEDCIRQSLQNFDAPVIIRQYEAADGTNGEYMAITRQFYDEGMLSYYLNDPNWKYNANWTEHSKVNPEQGWTLTSQQSYEAILRTSGRELYICQSPGV